MGLLMVDSIWPDEWYNPHILNPEYGIRPIDIDFRRLVYRAFNGRQPPVELPLRTTAERLATSPWLAPAAGYAMFDASARAVIDEVAWNGDVRWLPLVIETPLGEVEEYQIAAQSLDGGDFLYEPRTTRDPRGVPIRWVLDPAKLGDRQVLVVPGVTSAGLVMRGRVLQQLLDLGAKGIEIRHARVARSS
ncbi:MAG: hypothetical protein CVT64_11100 [Actinobacteria bacterium HGW-Actinobacteria-4]|nr:MAG: hypothetical protein CVT64_11100 [Actinobacteria bacterium HGW-Actinobacteria-4]